MKQWIVKGNKELSGTIRVDGAKNSLLAIIPASIITKSIVYLENVTPLEDTYKMINILRKLNVRVLYDNKSKMIIDSRSIKNVTLDNKEMKEIRASYYFMGALLSLFKNVRVIGPGGCKFASRPIDLHLFAFNKLGCKVSLEKDLYTFNKGRIKERIIKFKKVSVGATINAILASVKIKENIRLVNVAMEPEIDDLINFFNKCGAKIERKDKEIVIGYGKLKGCKHKIMYDRIEAGTYLILGACLGNNLKIIYNESEYLNSLIELFNKLGIKLKVNKDYISINKIEKISNQKLVFDGYPKIATDLQQPLSILMSKSETSELKDKIYPSRYTQIKDLNKMGFNMEVIEDTLFIKRSNMIIGNEVECKDLRGGVSLLIAGLIASGETNILNVEHIKRGYYDLVNKIKNIGGIIYEKD